jgi:DNA-binding transcriptional MocR family regulator
MKRATRRNHFAAIENVRAVDNARPRVGHTFASPDFRAGEVPRGARLPSSRTMARLLGVSRNTVLAAFDDLAADDLLRGERGAGMRVQGGAAAPEVTWFGLQQVIRAAGYPARVVTLADPDGNPIYLRY